MRKSVFAVASVVLVLLFLIANRGAYRSYFYGDDLDTLTWAPGGTTLDYALPLLSPVFSRSNFRPVAHYYYHVLGRTAGPDGFSEFLAVIQAIHLANTLLLFWVLLSLGLSRTAAFTGVVFFLFNPATFEGYWQPKCIFDVLCGTLCLLSFRAWIARLPVLSFLAFWCAYKAKEVAIMLPVVLLAFEYFIGQKRWKPLIPFFGVSMLFGVQALIANAHRENAYTFRMTPATVWTALRFFGQELRIAPWGLLLTGIGIALTRDRRFVFGLLAAAIMLLPFLALPGRAYAIYTYVPLIGGAIALSAFAEWRPRYVTPLFVAIWVPYTYSAMREYRNTELAAADERRSYVQQVRAVIRRAPASAGYVFEGFPQSLEWWGAKAAIRLFAPDPKVKVAWAELPDSADVKAHSPRVLLLTWNEKTRELTVNDHAASD